MLLFGQKNNVRIKQDYKLVIYMMSSFCLARTKYFLRIDNQARAISNNH